jgi:hypothetical protein
MLAMKKYLNVKLHQLMKVLKVKKMKKKLQQLQQLQLKSNHKM